MRRTHHGPVRVTVGMPSLVLVACTGPVASPRPSEGSRSTGVGAGPRHEDRDHRRLDPDYCIQPPRRKPADGRVARPHRAALGGTGHVGSADAAPDRASGRACAVVGEWRDLPASGRADAGAVPAAERRDSSLSQRDQVERIKALGDYLVADLPVLPLYNYATYLAVRKGVRAFDDVAGGSSDFRYGHYSRNAHLWDMD
jgi:hypothetical protein